MCHDHNGKCKKEKTEGIELQNQERTERLEKRKNYKYSRILKEDAIELAVMEKIASQMKENISRNQA